MILALRFNEQDQVIAAAPACDVHAVGDAYWVEMHPARITDAHQGSTGFLEIQDADLIEELLKLGIDDSVSCESVNRRMGSGDTATGSWRGAA